MEEKKSDRISISTGITHEIKKLMEEARERIEFFALIRGIEFFINLNLSKRERVEKILDEAQIIENRIEKITPEEFPFVSEKLRRAQEEQKQLLDEIEGSEKALRVIYRSMLNMHSALAKEEYVTKIENEDVVKDGDIMKESSDENITKERFDDLLKMFT